jgi:hypothetical protein
MSTLELLTTLVSEASPRVLSGRAGVLRQLADTLRSHDVPFTYDEHRFLHDRLYAAYTLHAQRRIVALMEQVASGVLTLGDLRMKAAALTGRLPDTSLALINRSEFDAVLAGQPASPQPEAAAALPWLDHSGMRSYVEASTSLALLGRRITQDQGVRNHSDEFHLFTINVDVVLDNAVKTAEAIVHEASHNALNVILEDRKITLKDNPLQWYSPWTKSHRHHRGIVHGFFAFTLVTMFYQRLQVPDFKAEIEAYANLQAAQLRTALPSLREILPDYPHELAVLIEQTYDSLG